MKKILLHLIGVGIFVFILSKVDFSKTFSILMQCAKPLLLLTALFGFLEILIKALRWKMILNSLNVKLSWLESLKYYWIGIFLGGFTPGKVGDFTKVAFIKDKENSSVFKAIISVISDRLIDVCTLAFCSMIAVFFIHKFKWHVIALAGVLTAALIFFVLILHKESPVRFLFSKMLARIAPSVHVDFENFSLDKILQAFKQMDKTYLLKIALVVVLGWASYFLEWFCLARTLHINIPFLFIMSTVAIAALVAIIPISISGIGTRDATIIFMFSQFAVPTEQALAFSISLLAISMFLNSLGFIPYLANVRKI